MKQVAVITGDVIGSTKLEGDDRLRLGEILQNSFSEINMRLKLNSKKKPFELYRGDSFQGLLQEPEKALRVAILLRAYLKKMKQSEKKNTLDARIAIGIGQYEYPARTFKESDGEAFRNSGRTLDEMKKKDQRLMIRTPWEQTNQITEIVTLLMDTLINDWTAQQAEVVYELLFGSTQTQVAEVLGVSQPAINKRSKAAKWHAIESAILFYENNLLKNFSNQ